MDPSAARPTSSAQILEACSRLHISRDCVPAPVRGLLYTHRDGTCDQHNGLRHEKSQLTSNRSLSPSSLVRVEQSLAHCPPITAEVFSYSADAMTALEMGRYSLRRVICHGVNTRHALETLSFKSWHGSFVFRSSLEGGGHQWSEKASLMVLRG